MPSVFCGGDGSSYKSMKVRVRVRRGWKLLQVNEGSEELFIDYKGHEL